MNHPAPRRRIEPLTPAPDRFDSVFREATARRYHRAATALGITGVFFAGIFGGLTIGGGPGAVTETVLNAAGLGRPTTPSSTTSTNSTNLASPIPSGAVTSGRKKGTVTAPPEQIAPIAPVYLRGEVQNTAGTPVGDLYVYSGVTSAQGFVPNATPVRTNSSGWYQIPCTGGPLLITPWLINSNLGQAATGAYAARFVDTPRCSETKHHLVTRVEEGAVLQGDVHTDVACAGTEFPLWLWIGGDRLAAVRLAGIEEGGRYRISGAPVGTSIVGARGITHAVTLRSGETEEQDVTYACPNLPTATPEPPTATPDETPTDPPTSPPPTDPSPSGTASATTPSSSGSPPST